MKQPQPISVLSFPALEPYRRDLARCVRCGVCASVCPSFLAVHQESLSARGRIALIDAVLDNRLHASAIFADRLATCTTCLACEAACPSNVPVAAIIQAAKADAVRSAGRGLISRFAAAALASNSAMRSLAWLAPIVLRYGKSGVGDPGSKISDFGAVNEKEKDPGSRGRIAFYPGCAIKYFHQDIGRSSVAVLERAGYEVIVLDDAACCGRPFLSLGDQAAARAAAERNQQHFASLGVDMVVTSCASCGLTFKQEYPEQLAPSEAVSVPVRDIHEVLAGCIPELALGTLTQQVTWHEPCHLGRGQGLAKTARTVLGSIPGIRITEMENPDRCCGFGGIMRIGHHDLSNSIGDAKANDIIKTNTQIVVTGCPGCRMQLADSLKRAGSGAVVLHTVQVVEEAMKKNECQG